MMQQLMGPAPMHQQCPTRPIYQRMPSAIAGGSDSDVITHSWFGLSCRFREHLFGWRQEHYNLYQQVDTWFWEQELASREAFLAKSADIVELEQRMRWLEHGYR